MKSSTTSKDRYWSLAGGIALGCSITFSSAFADDTEVFFGQVSSSSQTHPNVLFVLDTSGSMNSYDSESTTRLERMKAAMNTILDETTNVNVGLMRFNGWYGGGSVVHPVTPIDDYVCQGNSCGTLALSSKISEADGDAEERLSNDQVMLNGNSLELGEISPGSVGTERAVGLHFSDLGIPQGATIISAFIDFTSAGDNHSASDLQIAAEQVDSADVFEATNKNISDRTLGVDVDWAPEGWLNGEDYSTNDISPVIQEIVDRVDWCGGNNLNIVITGTGKRAARSYDSWDTTAPLLRLNYSTDNIPAGGGCMRYPAIAQAAAGHDDADQRISNGNNNTRRNVLYIPERPRRNRAAVPQINGLRFPDLQIPQGATIESAVIELTTNNDRTDDISVNIHAQNIGNAPQFSGARWDLSSRGLTSSETWTDPTPVGAGQPMLTPDLSSVLQEVVNRGDWAAGNAAAFLFLDNGGTGYRTFQSFDKAPNTPPKLKVIYRHTATSTGGTQVTVRDELKSIVNDMIASGGTPIIEAYYEAGRYLTGQDVDYGKNRGVDAWYNNSRYQRVSHPDSYTGGTVNRDPDCSDDNLNSHDCDDENITGTPTYVSPMNSSCQSNHIVFLTDGAPSSYYEQNKVMAFADLDSCSTEGGSGERCGRELSKWLSETDHDPSKAGKQSISTYTIGFNYEGDFLKDLASEGNGQYFKADSASQLVDVFKDILGDVFAVDTSFVAPGATVNQFNRLTHRNDIYFALFKPDQRPSWDGNLKRYEVDTDESGNIAILDAKGKPAVDPTTGFFRSDSESWWSDMQDGNTVALGGAANELDGTRRLFTYLGANNAIPNNGVDLTAAAHQLHENNNNIQLSHLGIANISATNQQKADLRDDLLTWSRGLDVQDVDDDGEVDDYRKYMGDPMHARPVIVNYATSGGAESTVFVGTNEGYLHAIERDEGQELYAFMPKELLGNILPFYDNQSSTSHPYGLDGALSIWTTDTNNNVMIDPGEKAFLYTGMRRGGNNYYALNIQDRMDPKLAWVIEGGPTGTPGFEELGQTWSRAVPNKILFNGTPRDVLIFAAGYDTNQDPDPSGLSMAQTYDSVGRGFYIVDAEDGTLLWSVLGNNTDSTAPGQYEPKMKYSVPTDIRALDTNNDGLTDQLYFGDMGGQIWRYDFLPQTDGGPLLQGGVMADLSTNSTQHQRRFYYEPDVAVISYEGERFLSISIGSGWRAHPLNVTVEDRFYVLRSHKVIGAPDGYGKYNTGNGQYTPITEADLVDVSTDIDAEVGPYGWFMDLPENGEKVLGDSVTVNNQVVFSSYKPELTGNDCTPAIGGGSVYVLNILNGSPRIDIDGDGDVDADDRSTDLSHGGIPPEPAVLITEHGPTVLVGPEQPVEPDFENLTQRTNWYKPSDDTAQSLVGLDEN